MQRKALFRDTALVAGGHSSHEYIFIKAVGLTQLAFHTVAVDSMVQMPLGDAYEHTDFHSAKLYRTAYGTHRKSRKRLIAYREKPVDVCAKPHALALAESMSFQIHLLQK